MLYVKKKKQKQYFGNKFKEFSSLTKTEGKFKQTPNTDINWSNSQSLDQIYCHYGKAYLE